MSAVDSELLLRVRLGDSLEAQVAGGEPEGHPDPAGEVPVHEDDTVESLAARVFEEEKLALPEAIRLHAGARGSLPA